MIGPFPGQGAGREPQVPWISSTRTKEIINMFLFTSYRNLWCDSLGLTFHLSVLNGALIKPVCRTFALFNEIGMNE